MTAIYKSSAARDVLQLAMNTAPVSQSVVSVSPAKADLALYNHDGSTVYTATNSISMLDAFDSGAGGEMDARIDPSLAGDTTAITATNSLPNIPATALTPLTYTFYDNYNYTGKLAFSGVDTGKLQAADTLYPEKRPISNMTNGLVTGQRVRVLGTDKWLTTTTYYDDRGRVVQVVSENNMGGKDVQTTLYSFKGNILATYLRHQNPKSITPQVTFLTSMTYDHGGRLLTVKKRLNDDVSQEKIVVSSQYDELGHLQQKRLGITTSGGVIDSLNFTYSVRGWLLGINKNFVNSANSTSNWFGQELSYDYGFDSSQYNGNIAGVKWKTRSDSTWAYGYSYDKASRLIKADFTQKNGANWAQDKKNFSVSNLTYDANGNIKSMWQKGMIGTKIETIDSLTYSYLGNSNKLSAVADIDSSRTMAAKLGDFLDGNKIGNDYLYDGNGNLVADLNKHISSIAYNYLNLPTTIVIDGKGAINYQYDALGNKLSKTIVDNTGSSSKTIISDYDGAFVYRQDSLELIAHEEGRIRLIYKTGNPITYAYDYFEKDHIGNVRTVLTDQTDFTMYTATMEPELAVEEVTLFSNIEDTRTEKPVGYPEDPTTEENKFVAKLNGKQGGKKIGPSLVLRVMTGDTVRINARAFYKSQGADDNSQKVPAEDMLAGLIQVFGGSGGENGSHASTTVVNNTPFNTDFYNNNYQRLKEKNQEDDQPNRPKAYLNFVLFNDNFNLVEDNSGVRQVKSNADELQDLVVEAMPVTENGFLYVYTSNESQQDVYFDNIMLGLNSGPLLEETHYYPFGLTMKGISTNALKGSNYAGNRIRYSSKELQNEEFSDRSGLEWYDFGARFFDDQIGRWHAQDPMSSKYYEYSPFNYALNNPLAVSDPNGMDVVPFQGTGWTFTGEDAIAAFNSLKASNRKNAEQADEGNDDDKDKKKRDNKGASSKNAFAPALLPLLGEGAGLFATGTFANYYKFPSGNDWAAVGNQLKYDWQHGITAELIAYIELTIDQAMTQTGSGNGVPYYDPALAKRMYDELTRIVSKTLNNPGFVYKLVALTDGYYNVYTRGIKLPTGKVYLKAGEIWKYGETTSSERYDRSYLANEGVEVIPIFTGTCVQIKMMEKYLLYGYYFQHGYLPAGNRIFR
jgi:RHS repeat-associated protein